MKNNNISKYGVEYPFQSNEYQTYMEEKCFERLGVKKSSQLKYVADKISLAVAKRYSSMVLNEDYNGTVYIIEFEENIKIGYTLNIESRFKCLRSDFGEFKILKIIETDKVKTLENNLHNICEEYRIVLPSGSGRTEFFKKEILKLKDMKQWLK